MRGGRCVDTSGHACAGSAIAVAVTITVAVAVIALAVTVTVAGGDATEQQFLGSFGELYVERFSIGGSGV